MNGNLGDKITRHESSVAPNYLTNGEAWHTAIRLWKKKPLENHRLGKTYAYFTVGFFTRQESLRERQCDSKVLEKTQSAACHGATTFLVIWQIRLEHVSPA